MTKKILVLPGDGIGPEIVAEAVKVLDKTLAAGRAIDNETAPWLQRVDTLLIHLAADHFKDGKFNFGTWLLSDQQIDQNIMSEAADFGDLVSVDQDANLKRLEQAKERQAALERAAKRRQQDIRRKLN